MIEELVRRALAGDQGAMRALLDDELYPLVEGHLARRFTVWGASRQELADCVQNVLLHLIERDARVLRRWDHQLSSLATYVRTVADNLVKSSFRRKPRPAPMEDPDAEQAPDSGPESKASFAELTLGLLAKLSDEDAALYHALYMEGLTPEEVADRFGISRDAAYQRRRRLLVRLKDLVSKLMASKRSDPDHE